MIRIINNTNWSVPEKYFAKYKARIERLFPVLNNKTFEIIEINDYHGQDMPDESSPLSQSVKEKDRVLRYDIIVYVKDYLGIHNNINTRFTKKELFALISHEIGHMVAYYERRNLDVEKEEFYADKCVLKLGLGKYMISALNKMIIDNKRSGSNYFFSTFNYKDPLST